MACIFVVDDDPVNLAILKPVFRQTTHEVAFFSDAHSALAAYQPGKVDLIISDFYMPGMDGSDLLRQLRRLDPDVGFVYLTSNQNLQMAVEMVKAGADDHIVKPIQPDELLARVRKNLDDTRQRQLLRRFQAEMEEEQLENQAIVNWRLMYATKETRQIEQAIVLMNRTMNQAGGFIWADILKSLVPDDQSDTVTLPREVINLVLEAARQYKDLFDLLRLIGELNTMDLDLVVLETAELIDEVQTFIDGRLLPLLAKYGRPVRFMSPSQLLPARYQVDLGQLKAVLFELTVNAIKYSPPESDVMLGWQQSHILQDIPLVFSLANRPAETQALHNNAWRIQGIPREYSEQVFELFYTLNAFPVHLEEEQWSNGTGLHIARKLMHRMGGWIQNHNIIDYTGLAPQPYVEFNLRFPAVKD